MINEDDYFAITEGVHEEYKDLINAAAKLVNVLCDGCKLQSCDNLDFCKYTHNLANVLARYFPMGGK